VAGVDEVQLIVTTADEVVPAIQTITTYASDYNEKQSIALDATRIPEVQVLRTTLASVPEVQTITVAANRISEQQSFTITFTGDTSDGSGNTLWTAVQPATGVNFRLRLDTTNMYWAASKADVTAASSITASGGFTQAGMQAHLESLSNVGAGQVTVGAPSLFLAVTDATVGKIEITYTVLFDGDNLRGDVPVGAFKFGSCSGGSINCASTSIGGVAQSPVNGNELAGTFLLTYRCDARVRSVSVIGATVGNPVVTLSVDPGTDVVVGDTFRFNKLGTSTTATTWHYATVIAKSTVSITLSAAPTLPLAAGPWYGESGDFYSDPTQPFGVSADCLAADPSTTPTGIDRHAIGTTVAAALQGLIQVPNGGGCVTVNRADIPATDPALVGHVYTVAFACGNGDLRDLICNGASLAPTSFTGVSYCTVAETTPGSMVAIGSTWSASILYPHSRIGTPAPFTTATPLSWRATAAEVKAELELVLSGGVKVWGTVAVVRTAYIPATDLRWSGQYSWSVTFTDRPGDVPDMTPAVLTGNAGITVATAAGTDGNEVSGTYKLAYCTPTTPSVCTSSLSTDFTATMTAQQFEDKFATTFFSVATPVVTATTDGTTAAFTAPTGSGLGVLDYVIISGTQYVIQSVTYGVATDTFVLNAVPAAVTAVAVAHGHQAVSVVRTGPTLAMGFTYTLEFKHKVVGGNIPALVATTAGTLTGTGATALVTDDLVIGNQLTGTFTLSYGGSTTIQLPSDSTEGFVEAALNSLNSIAPSAVKVTRTGPHADTANQVLSYTWSITFASHGWYPPTDHVVGTAVANNWKGKAASWGDTWPSTGKVDSTALFSKAWGKNVGDLVPINCESNGLSTTNTADASLGCSVSTVQQGTNPLAGSFKLAIDTTPSAVMSSGVAVQCVTGPIAHDAWPDKVASKGSGKSVQELLEATNCIGTVQVTRSAVNLSGNNGGYAWTVTFLRDDPHNCQQKDALGLCNAPGDVPKLTVHPSSFTTLRGTSLRNANTGTYCHL
jgi:hypothetical protein